MTLNRREVLVGAGGTLVALTVPRWALGHTEGRARFLGSARAPDENFIAALLDKDGGVLASAELPARGHGFALRPNQPEFVVFARRPGTYAMVLGGWDLNIGRTIHSNKQRHFYGHGCFSEDGALLFASENDYDNAKGIIGVYDANDNYRRIGEFDSGGIGPHEIRLMRDGKHLAVANGGIRTHPDYGRAKLNLAEMRPNFSILKIETGVLTNQIRFKEVNRQLSIRHLDINHQNVVALAMQNEGGRTRNWPLAAFVSPDGLLQFLRAPETIETAMRHYTGSIRFDGTGRYVAVTCPRGGLTVVWDVSTAEFVGSVAAPDSSSVSPADEPGSFLIAGSDGKFRRASRERLAYDMKVIRKSGYAWDNHFSEFAQREY